MAAFGSPYSSGGDAVSGIPMSGHLLGVPEGAGADGKIWPKGAENGPKNTFELEK